MKQLLKNLLNKRLLALLAMGLITTVCYAGGKVTVTPSSGQIYFPKDSSSDAAIVTAEWDPVSWSADFQSYSWTVEGGTVIQGDGTRTVKIKVATDQAKKQNIKASVKITYKDEEGNTKDVTTQGKLTVYVYSMEIDKSGSDKSIENTSTGTIALKVKPASLPLKPTGTCDNDAIKVKANGLEALTVTAGEAGKYDSEVNKKAVNSSASAPATINVTLGEIEKQTTINVKNKAPVFIQIPATGTTVHYTGTNSFPITLGDAESDVTLKLAFSFAWTTNASVELIDDFLASLVVLRVITPERYKFIVRAGIEVAAAASLAAKMIAPQVSLDPTSGIKQGDGTRNFNLKLTPNSLYAVFAAAWTFGGMDAGEDIVLAAAGSPKAGGKDATQESILIKFSF